MGEPVGKAGASVHLEQQLGQIHQRHACGNGRLERDQAGRLLQLVEGGQHQLAAVYLHSGVLGQVRRGILIGGVQALGQTRNLGRSVGREAQGAADGRPRRLPG